MHTLYIYNSTFFHNPFVSWDKINLHSALLASGGSDIIFKWNAGKSGGGKRRMPAKRMIIRSMGHGGSQGGRQLQKMSF